MLGCVLQAAIVHAEVVEPELSNAGDGVGAVATLMVEPPPGASGLGVGRQAAGAQSGECGWDEAPDDAEIVCFPAYSEGTSHAFRANIVDSNGNVIAATRREVAAYSTFDITAKDGEDYTGSSGDLVIERGQMYSSFVHMALLQDALDEPEERYGIKLEKKLGILVLSTDYVVFPIADDDPPVNVTIADRTGREDAGSLAFDVMLSGKSGHMVEIQYATSDGTATAPGDYGDTMDVLTIAPGTTSAVINVPIIHDGVAEADETFAVTLSNATNANVIDASATGTIEDTGAFPTVSVGSPMGAEDTVASLEFEVTLAPAPMLEATVAYATADGTATAGSDYEAKMGTLTFAVGLVGLGPRGCPAVRVGPRRHIA